MSQDRPLFRKLLVANRGEIALRVVRGARDLGIPTVAVYSDVDADLPHVRLADEAYCLGPAPATESYLNIERLLDVAERSGADAVHPGYGFLSENADFVRACAAAGLTFVGPPAEAMDQMGDKIASRRSMQAAGVPIVPGAIDPVTSLPEAAAAADEAGYPVIVKASAGGGGKGIRVVQSPDELPRAISNAQEEAGAAFGDGAVFVEKLLRGARHIEVQVIADAEGNVVTLGERECSLQRRRQKLIEEAPSAAVGPGLRARLEEAAATAVRACGYRNAGTVEFLVYGENEDQVAFLEVNARLQVEHPVTELVRGVDLVRDQLRVAAGLPLGYTGADRPIQGWAMECRITAEDPYAGFLPAIGPIHAYREPAGPGVRVDGMLHPGMEVSLHYDSLLAKLITWGEDRDQCIRRMRRALREFSVAGVHTTIPFHLAMLDDPNFLRGAIHIDYVEEEFQMPAPDAEPSERLAALAAAAYFQTAGERDPEHANGALGGWAGQARTLRSPSGAGWRR
ncbi:MAG: acetyl-CoA carboxylase biotin carboxylase subunit [Chloroflexi bacterium]|nr:acetyl-CoA carboxylase biotin carboxylase subunit [Chloroflexota bacterium]